MAKERKMLRSATKNTAIVYHQLYKIETKPIVQRGCLDRAVGCFSRAFTYASQMSRHINDYKWFTKAILHLRSTVQDYLVQFPMYSHKFLVASQLTVVELKHPLYCLFMGNFWLDLAQDCFDDATKHIKAANVKAALRSLGEIYTPIESAKAFLTSSNDKGLQTKVQCLDQEVSQITKLTSCLQDLNMIQSNNNHCPFSSADRLRLAIREAQGMDLPTYAKAAILLAKIFICDNLEQDKSRCMIKAKEVLEQAIETVKPSKDMFDRKDDYIVYELEALHKLVLEWIKEYGPEAVHNKLLKVVTQELTPLDRLLQRTGNQKASVHDIGDFVLDKFPPVHQKQVTNWQLIKRDHLEKSQRYFWIRLLKMYHSDKIVREQYETKYVLWCEEIYKRLCSRYESEKHK